VLNQHIYRIRPNRGVDLNWLNSALMVVTTRIEAKAHGFKSSLVHVCKSDITDELISFPPLPEQRRIAEILGSWDRAIETQQKLITAKTNRLRSLRHHLLTGSRRFPEFQGKWRKAEFGDFLAESRIPGSNGRDAKRLTLKLYGKGLVPKSDERKGSENTIYFTRRRGHFIYSKLDFLNGAFAIVPDELDGFQTTTDVPAFEIDTSQVNAAWLLAFTVREEFYKRGVGYAAGGRKARRVHPEQFLSIPLDLPPLPEQTRIASFLNAAQYEITLLTNQLEALKQQKRGLMHQLLTGEIRVPI
jgi:type I restriction enzyme S subunit